jgi:hypothetical protein
MSFIWVRQSLLQPFDSYLMMLRLWAPSATFVSAFRYVSWRLALRLQAHGLQRHLASEADSFFEIPPFWLPEALCFGIPYWCTAIVTREMKRYYYQQFQIRFGKAGGAFTAALAGVKKGSGYAILGGAHNSVRTNHLASLSWKGKVFLVCAPSNPFLLTLASKNEKPREPHSFAVVADYQLWKGSYLHDLGQPSGRGLPTGKRPAI